MKDGQWLNDALAVVKCGNGVKRERAGRQSQVSSWPQLATNWLTGLALPVQLVCQAVGAALVAAFNQGNVPVAPSSAPISEATGCWMQAAFGSVHRPTRIATHSLSPFRL